MGKKESLLLKIKYWLNVFRKKMCIFGFHAQGEIGVSARKPRGYDIVIECNYCGKVLRSSNIENFRQFLQED